MYWVYIIKSLKDGTYYTGSTQEVETRLKKHNTGQSAYTKKHIPFIVVYKERFDTRLEAVKREFQIKSYKKGEAFKKLIS